MNSLLKRFLGLASAETELKSADSSSPRPLGKIALQNPIAVHSVTFPVDDVQPSNQRLIECTTLEALTRIIRKELIVCTSPYQKVIACGYQPLIAAAFLAFSQHRRLVLSPDLVWITITQGVAQHIANNAESLRHLFVAHRGKIEIVAITNVPWSLAKSIPWADLINQIRQGVKRHVGTEMDALFSADFSTTGELERTVSNVVILDSFQQYFEYVAVCICGIPSVTLEGTTEDWVRLRQKVKMIEWFELGWWTNHLLPICDHFVRASQGDVDIKHWQNLCKLKDEYGGAIMNGWIAKLIPYIRTDPSRSCDTPNPALKGKELFVSDIDITSRHLPNGLSLVPFSLVEESSGDIYPLQFVAGFSGVRHVDEDLAVRPQLGWAVRHAPSQL